MQQRRENVHLLVDDLCFGYDNTLLFKQLNLSLIKGSITVFIGPNGCGKSTLLRNIARLLKPSSGEISLAGKNIESFANQEFAKSFAFLAQTPTAPDELTIFQLVKLGRYAHQSFFKEWSAEDSEQVEKALRATDIYQLRDRKLNQISGGQKQRAWVSVVLAQDAETIALDEPINHLDMSYQLECLNLIKQINVDYGKTILLVLHDINLAARYADYIFAMRNGEIRAQGKPADIINTQLIEDIFSMKSHIIEDPIFHTPLCIPIASLRKSR